MNRKRVGARHHMIGLLLTLSLAVSGSAVALEPVSGLVSTEWLASNLARSDLRIVDVRDSIQGYWQAHIPGAVYLSPEAMRWPDRGVPVKLMPLHVLASLLGRMGVSREMTVVLYSEEGDYKAPYLIWALDYLGHRAAVVLEGGFSKWNREGRAVTQDYPAIVPTRYPVPSFIHEEVRASLDEVKRVGKQADAVLIDVRPTPLYTGETGPWKRRGHIKGTISHFWGDDLKEGGTWRSAQELRKVYEKLGATPNKRIIVTCGQGQMSAHTYFTLKHVLRYPMVENYDGGFNEWSNIDQLPVETGMKP